MCAALLMILINRGSSTLRTGCYAAHPLFAAAVWLERLATEKVVYGYNTHAALCSVRKLPPQVDKSKGALSADRWRYLLKRSMKAF